MRIRYINNIVIELQEWEARALVDFLREGLKEDFHLPLGASQTALEICEQLEKVIVREW